MTQKTEKLIYLNPEEKGPCFDEKFIDFLGNI